jgi:hypothetical protein
MKVLNQYYDSPYLNPMIGAQARAATVKVNFNDNGRFRFSTQR